MSDFEGSDIDMPDAGQSTKINPNVDPNAIYHSEEEFEKQYPNRPHNHGQTLPFHDLYLKLFEPLLENKQRKVVGLRGHKELKPHEIRSNIIQNFISRWRSEVGSDIFPAFRLILCDNDRDRSVYNLKEQKIGKLLIKAMQIDKRSSDAQALVNWRVPVNWSKSAGDFAFRCYEVIKKRPMRTTPGELTIAEVNEKLDALSRTSNEASQLPIFVEFYNKMCAEELLWLIRIILKQIKVGATENTFFYSWHPDADALFNVSSSLRRVCWELWDPKVRLESDNKGVVLMSCFQPQLAQFQKKSLVDVVKAMEQPEGFWIEEKLDGERMQMHYHRGEFKWWSRKAKEYTHLYGSGFDNGSLSRFMKDVFAPGVESVILDGEMITWDPVSDYIVAFGTLKTAAIETSNNPHGDQHRPLFRVFDILYLNGQSIIDYTGHDRRSALTQVIRPVHRRIEIHPITTATTADEIESQLRQVISTAGEGLVVKNPVRAYHLNDRNDSWIKVKPEYLTGFGESLDCLVIGGYYGSGSRGSKLSSYLCGLRVDGDDLAPGQDEMTFWSFFKVGGGFTANDYAGIAHRTEDKWHSWIQDPPPKGLFELAGGAHQFERPDVWIHPTDSFVIEAKAASVNATDQFRPGFTLRFPRFKKLRPDRDWRSALTLTSFRELRAEAAAEAANKKIELEIRRGGAKRTKRELRVVGDDGSDVPVFATSPNFAKQLFKDTPFYVMTDANNTGNTVGVKHTKASLEALLKSQGARITQNDTAAGSDTIALADRPTVKVAALAKKGTIDILRPVWALDCIKQGELLPLEPERHILHAAYESTLDMAEENVDEFGDPFSRDTDVDELTKTLAMVDVLPGEIKRAQEELKQDEKVQEVWQEGDLDMMPASMFKHVIAYVDSRSVKGPAEVLLRFCGAMTVDTLPTKAGVVTHIVLGQMGGTKRITQVREIVAAWGVTELPRIVGEEWAEESIAAGTVVDEERFVV